MSSETNKDTETAIVRIKQQMESILEKYRYGVRKDTGLNDAMDYASLRLEEWRIHDPSAPPENHEPLWAMAEREADTKNGSPELLRDLLRKEAHAIFESSIDPQGPLWE